MTDELLEKYSKNNPNFYDGYWRNNPRRDSQCSPMLYGDSYRPFFQTDLTYGNLEEENVVVEEFANLPSAKPNIQRVNTQKINKYSPSPSLASESNDVSLDSYSYLGEDMVESIKCDGKTASVKLWQQQPRMYDIDIPTLMKKEVIGDMKEIDNIHNQKIKNTTFFGDMKLQHLSQTMKNVHYHVNPKMLEAHQRSFKHERFFQDH